ncbi:MAG: hypothetical protein AAGJ18_12495 [Bacteroidota bacterium]
MHLRLLRTSYCLLLSSFCCTISYAQNTDKQYPKNSKILYRTIHVKEDVGQVVVAIDGQQDFEYDHWEGDAILVEQEIHLENTPKSVFNELMRQKRYHIVESFQSNALLLHYENRNKKDLQINYKDANEKVYLRLLVPENIEVELKRKT